MANKRMFSMDIADSDAFLEMPLSSQALYFHLSMRADDDGFVKNPKKTQRIIGASDDDLKILIAKRFILPFDSGIVVIKHWKINNTIRSDRYKPTTYIEEKSMLVVKENGAYTEAKNLGIPSGIPNDNQVGDSWLPQYSIGKSSIDLGKYSCSCSSENDNHNNSDFPTKNDEFSTDLSTNSQFELQNGSLGRGVVLLTPEQDEALLDKLGFDGYNHYVSKLADFIIEKEAKVGNHYATILKWAREDSKL
jgi:hypothetical protein